MHYLLFFQESLNEFCFKMAAHRSEIKITALRICILIFLFLKNTDVAITTTYIYYYYYYLLFESGNI